MLFYKGLEKCFAPIRTTHHFELCSAYIDGLS